jgi:two-component system cell cycle response regulator DivK
VSKILVVEDNATNMKLSTFLLESVDHDVIPSVIAEMALTLARDSHPDLILMDIQLPDWTVSKRPRLSRPMRPLGTFR